MNQRYLLLPFFLLLVTTPWKKSFGNIDEKNPLQGEKVKSAGTDSASNNKSAILLDPGVFIPGMYMDDDKPKVNPNEKPAWQIGLATNPLSLFLFNQIAVSVDLIRAKKSHELRFNFIKDATKLLWKTEDDPGFTLPKIKYSGYQLSYTLKFVHQKPFDHYKYIYQGPQVRYINREYEDVKVTMIHKETKDTLTNQFIHSGSQVFDLVFVTGQQVRWKLLFLDLYAGAGIGYKTMTANTSGGLLYKDLEKYDLWEENLEDKETRFKPTRWNRVYVPTRAGIRIGMIF